MWISACFRSSRACAAASRNGCGASRRKSRASSRCATASPSGRALPPISRRSGASRSASGASGATTGRSTRDAMTGLPTRPLGRAGLNVSILGLGCAPLGDLYDLLDDDVALNTVATAANSGVPLFDVAPLYGRGLAEHRLGTVLKRLPRDGFVLSTKVGRRLMPAPGGPTTKAAPQGVLSFDVLFDYSYDGTMRALEQSLHRLALPLVDIALIHDVDVWTHGDAMEE